VKQLHWPDEGGVAGAEAGGSNVRRKLFMAGGKESAATANECHCEHEATCALYGWKMVGGRQGVGGLGSEKGAWQWCMSHEATKSNCVATDCALLQSQRSSRGCWFSFPTRVFPFWAAVWKIS